MSARLSESSGKKGTSSTGPHEGSSHGLGELLRHARTVRGLTLEEISKETRIPRRHLEALEHGNLAGLPAGFYRRAQLRAYARAVNLDQNLALMELDRAEAVPETPRSQPPAVSRGGVLIVLGVVAAAALFGYVRGIREPALPGDAAVSSAIDSAQYSVQHVRETLPAAAVAETLPRTQSDQVAPRSAPSDGALVALMKPTGDAASVTSSGDHAVTTEQTESRASPGSVTELVVTTEPAGARVTVNGIGWGLAPVTIRHLPAGDKRIRVSKEGYATEERVVRLAAGRLRTLDVQLRSAP
jgi:cytoskeletal protein RodZ